VRNHLAWDLLILHGVVQKGSDDEVRVLAVRGFCNQGGDLKQVSGFLGGPLALVVNMPPSGCISRLQNRDSLFHRASLISGTGTTDSLCANGHHSAL